MRLFAGLAAALLLAGAPVLGAEDSPHLLRGADGKPDMEKCGICHEEDNKTLSRTKVETCTLCHEATPHSGAAEHLRADAAAVARRVPKKEDGSPALPLAEEGTIYCGTCHLFHDPVLGEQPPLSSGWLPPSDGLSGAIRQGLSEQWEGIAQKYEEKSAGASFATEPVVRLRFPAQDGVLCQQCHRELVGR